MVKGHSLGGNYSEFVGMIDERNRPSGGIKTIQIASMNARVNNHSKVLEIGSNTGFTSVNINLITGAQVIGVDVNLPSVQKAEQYAEGMGAKDVRFINTNATNLPFPDETFDLVWCSNVTSFIRDRDKAISEYLRVLKRFGTLVVVPIYYRKRPPIRLIKEISTAIGNNISAWDKNYWLDLFRNVGVEAKAYPEIYFVEDYKYLDQSDRIESYVEEIIGGAVRRKLIDANESRIMRERASYYYSLFNENNGKYAGYSIILMQKRNKLDETELFLTEKV